MEVTSIPADKPFVIDTDRNYGGRYHDHGHSRDNDWPERTAERSKNEFNARFFADSINSGNQFAAAQTAVAGVSKDVAVLSRDVVISEGRTAVAIQTVNANVGLLSKDLQISEKNLLLEMSKLAAQQAECCCELKELVREQNAQTRELIQSNKILELENRLRGLK
jgi:hypothetical protein